ncbi:hypothetical protein EVAR_35277_1 [Eumeta japonica]|uniref:Uncharacterized protein n=1 Tax=Eumeta variegata TaxID=151549 RepID=A0A4C1VCW1_EUMVA|nr:hypothetical protein EVAR_35277_1 [Eumeta japonica]
MEKRTALLPQLLEEKEKGNTAYLKYDKLVVKGPNPDKNSDKRKRELSTSPQSTSTNKPKKQQTISSIKTNRTNAFNLMRTRSNSLNDKLIKNNSNQQPVNRKSNQFTKTKQQKQHNLPQADWSSWGTETIILQPSNKV